eukprot:TRINITY_DN3217_c0_g1_i2.p1 TRINITY_DN3217_c0_g1~~TRINITY_DN3217_c0_g1_i2.p1  ORF type:complete len:106 (+),score=2.74 TRINITY_DN3217_c0_g1_i2:219-536(+)
MLSATLHAAATAQDLPSPLWNTAKAALLLTSIICLLLLFRMPPSIAHIVHRKNTTVYEVHAYVGQCKEESHPSPFAFLHRTSSGHPHTPNPSQVHSSPLRTDLLH